MIFFPPPLIQQERQSRSAAGLEGHKHKNMKMSICALTREQNVKALANTNATYEWARLHVEMHRARKCAKEKPLRWLNMADLNIIVHSLYLPGRGWNVTVCSKTENIKKPKKQTHSLYSRHQSWRLYRPGLRVLHAAGGTKSPIDLPERNKTTQWFLLEIQAGSVGQNPTSVLWELEYKDGDRQRAERPTNWVELCWMQAFCSSERHNGRYMTGHIYTLNVTLHSCIIDITPVLAFKQRASICSFTSSANPHASA